MTITQEELIRQIAQKENIDAITVRSIFRSAEHLIFQHLSSATPDENVVIKVLNGLSLECNYMHEREIHRYDDIKCSARIWTKPKITRYYNRKLNRFPKEVTS